MKKDRPFTIGKEAWSHLEKIIYSRSRDRVFRDWLDLMLSSHLALTDNLQRHDFDTFSEKLKTNTFDSIYNDRYMEIVKGYEKEHVYHFANAYASLLKETQETGKDVLGSIYMERITYGEHGQFFTPDHISRMMAEVVGPTDGKVCDPTCGSGTMLIEASKVNPDGEFYGTDLDPRCARMCALNMLFFDLNAVVEEGNTLAMKIYKRWVIRKGGYIWEHEPKEEEHEEPQELGQAALPLAA